MDPKELEMLQDFLKQYIKGDQFLEISRSTERKILKRMKETLKKGSPFLENENFLGEVSHIIIRSMLTCIGEATLKRGEKEVEKAKKKLNKFESV